MNNKIAFWKHYPVADQTGEALAKETIDWQSVFNFDFVKITPAGSWQATCYGLGDSWNGDFLGRRIIGDKIINELSDWNKIQEFTNVPSQLEEQIKAVELVCKEIKNVPVYATIFCPITQAIQMAGIDVFKKHWESNREIVEKALYNITQNTIFTIQKFKENGASGLYMATQAQQKSFLSFDEYTEAGKKWDSKCLKVATDLLEDVIFHLHGEAIYCCVEEMKNLRVHFENASQLDETLHQINIPKIIGIPAKELLTVNNELEIKALLKQTNNQSDLVACGCVLPLDFSEEVVKKWIDYVRVN